jgi:hypothetical protein
MCAIVVCCFRRAPFIVSADCYERGLFRRPQVAIEPEIERPGGTILDLRQQPADASSLQATARRLLALAARRLFGR